MKISARFDDQGVKSPKIRFRPWNAHLKKFFVLCWYFWTRSQCAKFEAKRVKISGVTGGVEKRYRHFFMTSISGPYVGFYSTDFENSLTGRLLRVASHRVPTGIREGHLKRQSREGTSLNGRETVSACTTCAARARFARARSTVCTCTHLSG